MFLRRKQYEAIMDELQEARQARGEILVALRDMAAMETRIVTLQSQVAKVLDQIDDLCGRLSFERRPKP